jgi:preprotein translocase subunit SecE
VAQLVEQRSPKPQVGGSIPSWPAIQEYLIFPITQIYLMSAQTAESTTQVFDVVKQVISIILVVAGVAAFYYFSEISLLYRVLTLVATVLVAVGLVLTTGSGRNVWGFILDSKQEVRRVVWPTREETIRTTLMVFVMVFIVGLVLWCLDMFLFWGIRLLTGQV